jgi:cellulose synthase/poly-beta-1,6-N-acetylglucosamine synthase-like glycosyltransferase
METDVNLPFVSVIVPTYNEEKNIARCLSSVINQDYPKDKLEVIVVDSVSKDNTVKIANDHGARVIFENKQTIGNAFKIGTEDAKGELIALVGADSELPQRDFLRKMVSAFSDPSVCGTFTCFRVSKTYSSISRCYHLMRGDPLINFAYPSIGSDASVLTMKNYYPTAATILRKELVLKVGNFKEHLPRMEDIDLTYRLLQNGYRLIFVPNTYIYHHFVDSLSSYTKKTYKRILIFINYHDFCAFTYAPKNLNGKISFLKNILVHMSILGLLIPVAKGIKKDRDISWFYYPVIVLTTIIIQLFALISNTKGRKLLKEFIGIT